MRLWLGVAGAVGLLVLVWWTVTELSRTRSRAAQAEAGEVLAKVDAKASEKSAEAVGSLAERTVDRVKTSEENEHDINSQTNASLPSDPGLRAATLRSLCKRAAHFNKPECVQLRKAGATGAP